MISGTAREEIKGLWIASKLVGSPMSLFWSMQSQRSTQQSWLRGSAADFKHILISIDKYENMISKFEYLIFTQHVTTHSLMTYKLFKRIAK